MAERRAGRELDAEVAAKVMGEDAISTSRDGPDLWFASPDDEGDWIPVPHYSTDIAAAGTVIDRVVSRGASVSLLRHSRPQHSRKWECEFWDGPFSGVGQRGWHAHAPTAPLAICLAALEAVEGSHA